jgi:predicted ATPase
MRTYAARFGVARRIDRNIKITKQSQFRGRPNAPPQHQTRSMSLIVREIHASGYRSLRAIRMPVAGLGVFVGANVVGKTNLYRALQLLQASAAGTLSHELAAEGGMESALWAGKRMAKQPARIGLAVACGKTTAGEPAYRYEVAIGLVPSYETADGERRSKSGAFALEPQVKEETLVFHDARRPLKLLERRGPPCCRTRRRGKPGRDRDRAHGFGNRLGVAR